MIPNPKRWYAARRLLAALVLCSAAASAFAQAMQAKLRAFCDPDAVDRRAKQRQMELLERFGGYEEAMKTGDLGYTPAPGSRPDFNP